MKNIKFMNKSLLKMILILLLFIVCSTIVIVFPSENVFRGTLLFSVIVTVLISEL